MYMVLNTIQALITPEFLSSAKTLLWTPSTLTSAPTSSPRGAGPGISVSETKGSAPATHAPLSSSSQCQQMAPPPLSSSLLDFFRPLCLLHQPVNKNPVISKNHLKSTILLSPSSPTPALSRRAPSSTWTTAKASELGSASTHTLLKPTFHGAAAAVFQNGNPTMLFLGLKALPWPPTALGMESKLLIIFGDLALADLFSLTWGRIALLLALPLQWSSATRVTSKHILYVLPGLFPGCSSSLGLGPRLTLQRPSPSNVFFITAPSVFP